MPDLNSVSASPRIPSLSRRTSSQQMPPPSAPASGSPPSDAAFNILPSNMNAVTTGAPIAPIALPAPSPRLAATGSVAQQPADTGSFTSGPGPTRHPRPLTAAELHQELEKEQEAVVCPSNSSMLDCHSPASVNHSGTGKSPHARTRPPPSSAKRLRCIQRLFQFRECLHYGPGDPHHSRRQTAFAFRHGFLYPVVKRAPAHSKWIKCQWAQHSSDCGLGLGRRRLYRQPIGGQYHRSGTDPTRRHGSQPPKQYPVTFSAESQQLSRSCLFMGFIPYGRRRA